MLVEGRATVCGQFWMAALSGVAGRCAERGSRWGRLCRHARCGKRGEQRKGSRDQQGQPGAGGSHTGAMFTERRIGVNTKCDKVKQITNL